MFDLATRAFWCRYARLSLACRRSMLRFIILKGNLEIFFTNVNMNLTLSLYDIDAPESCVSNFPSTEHRMTDSHGPSDGKNAEKDLSDALASLSLTTELDSALLDHLNLLDKYMFHVECLSQLFRLVCSPITYFPLIPGIF